MITSIITHDNLTFSVNVSRLFLFLQVIQVHKILTKEERGCTFWAFFILVWQKVYNFTSLKVKEISVIKEQASFFCKMK